MLKNEGDASHRKFFRKKNKNKLPSLFLQEKKKNLIIYDSINKILNKNKILAPQLYKEKYNKNCIEIQDFGNDTIYKILTKNNQNILKYFKQIIDVLIKIQSIKDRSIKNFKNKNYIIPKYEKKILFEEANLFCDWYLKNYMSKKST